MTNTQNTKTVHVISQHRDGGGGGFFWYPETVTREQLDEAFDSEVKAWAGEPTVVRLVAVDVPADLTGQELTDWLDDEIDSLEETLPALREITTK